MNSSTRFPTLDTWPMWVSIKKHTSVFQGTISYSWTIEDMCSTPPSQNGYHALTLRLHPQERVAYRHNLNAEVPRLYVLCNQPTANECIPIQFTLSRQKAINYQNNQHLVLSIPLPRVIEEWIEDYFSIQTELERINRKQRREQRMTTETS